MRVLGVDIEKDLKGKEIMLKNESSNDQLIANFGLSFFFSIHYPLGPHDSSYPLFSIFNLGDEESINQLLI